MVCFPLYLSCLRVTEHFWICGLFIIKFIKMFAFYFQYFFYFSNMYNSNHLTEQFSDIKCISSVVWPSPLSISKTFSSSQTEALSLLNNNSFLSSAANNVYSTLCLYEFVQSRYFIQMESDNILSFCVWLISRSVCSRFIQVVAWIRTSFLF